MKRSVIIFVSILLVLFLLLGYFQLTGKVVQDPPKGKDMLGPSAEGISCMKECTTRECDISDIECRTAKSNKCGQECNVDVSGPPTPANEGELCMQKCVVKGCDKFDIACQNTKRDKCEGECNMKGDAPDESKMNAEQICISNCVAAEDLSVICENSKEGEIGNTLCQRCAQECVYLYEGPCLDDEELKEKEKECETCEHCYGEPVEGPSGEGWDCIVNVECKDASSEFGDESGEGPGIGQEGYIAPNPVAKTVDGVVKFFKWIFGAGKNNPEE